VIATNIWFWIAFNAFVLGLLALDLGVFHRKAHAVKPKEAAMWTGVWVSLALLFCAGLALWKGTAPALTFLTGYVIEQSLSVDNIFVIVLIFQYFKIPEQYQHRVLFWGIIGALLMRGAFIGVGAILIQRFHWILYVFGAFLVITGIRMGIRKEEDEFDAEHNIVMRLATRFFPFTKTLEGQHFLTLENGKRVGTPLLLVLIMVEFTDLIFAVDSIPAIFAVTTDPFLVYTSNVFAILGLRSLYFLLADIIFRFHYLHYGLAIILSFVGVKMLIEKYLEIPIWLSLVVIVAVLAGSIVASLVWPEDDPVPDVGVRSPTVTEKP
jgi:tellurite resistance protein TerC